MVITGAETFFSVAPCIELVNNNQMGGFIKILWIGSFSFANFSKLDANMVTEANFVCCHHFLPECLCLLVKFIDCMLTVKATLLFVRMIHHYIYSYLLAFMATRPEAKRKTFCNVVNQRVESDSLERRNNNNVFSWKRKKMLWMQLSFLSFKFTVSLLFIFYCQKNYNAF